MTMLALHVPAEGGCPPAGGDVIAMLPEIHRTASTLRQPPRRFA